MKQIEFHAMGSQMAVFVDRDDLPAVQALAKVPSWFEEWEQILSRFRPDSDLNRLNGKAGQPVRVHPILLEVIEASLQAARMTDGLVLPTLLKPLQQAGYEQSFDRISKGVDAPITRVSTSSEVAGETNWGRIEIDRSHFTVCIPASMGLDLGGIGKGWAAWQAMQRLEEIGPVLVDASGDLAISGPRADGSPWAVGIADPLRVQESLGLLAVDAAGVATSGVDYHRWMKDGAWKHHIIDPRTRQPAETDLVSVTVVAPDAIQAEAAAKAALIQGSETGLAWLESRPELSGLLASQDGRVLVSSGMPQLMWS
jgi:thiamine biosynthesis lipoprotein